MAAEAFLSTTWKRRMYFIIAFCVAIGLWFLYDGLIAWPKQNEIFTAHQQYEKEGRESEWGEYARSRGWEERPPEHLHERSDLMGQYVLGTVGLLAGACAAAWLAMSWKRSLRSDEEAVYSDTGVRVPFSEMRRVDKRKWDNKGIAVVIYEHGGKKRKLTLDDYKYIGGEKILNEVEEYLAAQAEKVEKPELPRG